MNPPNFSKIIYKNSFELLKKLPSPTIMVSSLLWPSLLLTLLIQISFLPYQCNATGGNEDIGIKEHLGLGQVIKLTNVGNNGPVGFVREIPLSHQQGNSSNASGLKTAAAVHSSGIKAAKSDNQSLAKIEHQIIKEVREKYTKINERPYTDGDQNEKDERSMKEVIEIFEQISNNLKKNIKIFNKILMDWKESRNVKFFVEIRKQEIAYEESMKSPKALERLDSMSKNAGLSEDAFVRLDSFSKKTSFEQKCVDKILAIFTLADNIEKDLRKQVKNTIGIVENAVEFYEMKNEQNYQGSEMGDMMAEKRRQMKIFKSWLKEMQYIIEEIQKKIVEGGMYIDDIMSLRLVGENIFVEMVKKDSPFVAFFADNESASAKKEEIVEIGHRINSQLHVIKLGRPMKKKTNEQKHQH